ncbi:adenylate/guanylate cyclase domain-containing protein [Thermospira aquatica]|uniref:Adenylate/guanylate cyclase domain-containing protein n=1 Tax=Thermospira aquatica TaxID=2828656 RepID=A0AAX3BCD7_9SPIR|nr:adenylate/guanylate cyclase domain-containing protein [Thermospira aquatica]URA09937.1 adenylate/guanylate cyclase domain-containing protein [Thermospira aquatica]
MGQKLFRKIGKTRIFPFSLRVAFIFSVFMLVSNFATNYINIALHQEALVEQLRLLLVENLKEIYTYAGNQYEIYEIQKDLNQVQTALTNRAKTTFKNAGAIFAMLDANGNVLAAVGADAENVGKETLSLLLENQAKGTEDGFLFFKLGREDYILVYKYHPRWKAFIIRGERLREFYARSNQIFWIVLVLIIVISLLLTWVGLRLLRSVTKYLHVITESILKMTQEQHLDLIDLRGASNDDITFLGAAFNSLSSTVNNLLFIFRKFVNKDIALQAYREKEVRLEGREKELTILFSDIKSFTFITETLGTDIIKLLNLHYDRAIREILHRDGIIGSIIGDALLAVFGVLEGGKNKSYQALQAAYGIQTVARSLREKMQEKKRRLLELKQDFTEEEERLFKAVMLEVGVGIDGGRVFYGNIGSYERMTNTVIGDNVNAASRLEGLTRVYGVPVICSEYVKNDVEFNGYGEEFVFVELDQVQVKGKTQGKRIYWPLLRREMHEETKRDIELFARALQHYYVGEWEEAERLWRGTSLPCVPVFLERIEGKKPPKGWNGIWTMTSK